MADIGYPYAISIIRTREGALPTRERILRLADTPRDQLARALGEMGFASSSENWEQVLSDYIVSCHDLLLDIAPEPRLIMALFRGWDALNLQVLLKCRVLGRDAAKMTVPYGAIEVERLARLVQEGDAEGVPEPLTRAALEWRERQPFDAFLCDAALDVAAREQALADGRGHAFLAEYFAALSDFDNVALMVRSKAAAWPMDRALRAFMPGGNIDQDALQAWAQAMDGPAPWKGLPYGDALSRGVDKARATGSTAALERERDDSVLALCASHRYESFTVQPLIGYYLAACAVVSGCRLVCAGREAGLDADVIRERLREQYVG
nr:V-type ATPase subunit [bacterium]